MITSCGGGPSGNPQKDAENFKDLYNEIEEIKLKIEEKKLEVHQYYADNKDSTEYNKFVREVDEVAIDVPVDFKKENKEKYDKINEGNKIANEKISGKSESKNEE
jgi:hypothetical protein